MCRELARPLGRLPADLPVVVLDFVAEAGVGPAEETDSANLPLGRWRFICCGDGSPAKEADLANSPLG